MPLLGWLHPDPRRSLGGRTPTLGKAPPERTLDTDARSPGPVPTATRQSDRG